MRNWAILNGSEQCQVFHALIRTVEARPMDHIFTETHADKHTALCIANTYCAAGIWSQYTCNHDITTVLLPSSWACTCTCLPSARL